MNNSYETFAKSQRNSRRRVARMILFVLAGVLVIATVAWFSVTQPIRSSSQVSYSALADRSRLERDVRLLSIDFAPRDYSHVENLDRAASYIHGQFESAGARVSEQAFDVNGRTYRNIIGMFGPDSGDRIVVGAHYDGEGLKPAADDNASGVAGLLELARLIGQTVPGATVELVAYSLEEPPFFRTAQMGSAFHASGLRNNGVNVRAMFSLEMIGYFSDTPGSQRFPNPLIEPFYPSTGSFISIVGNLGQMRLVRRVKGAMAGAAPLPVYSINAPAWIPGIDFSDHLNYNNAGFPAIMITDTAFYRNSAYHTSRDTADRLDYKRMGMVVEQVHAAVKELSR
jgi:Zn-dependent M28 family amino/carboxypeptidase